MGASGFRELSDQHGFVAVYPDGVGGSWHVNGCCGQAAQEELDEIGFVRAVLADVTAQVCIDPKRIYASGISQGGGMAHHVGCLAADVFAAIAPVSSDLRTEPCEPSRAISELSFRGMADNLSPYGGGPVGPVGMQYQAIGAKETLERWRTIDECTGTPEPMLELCETYAQCADGVEVSLCSIPGGGHVLYSNPSSFDVAGAAWAMFERQSQKP
jgi:polyhydroxybutyrate depolymerase